MDSELPVYEFAIEFFTVYLGIRPETGRRYLKLGILSADAFSATNRRALFKVDAESVARHREEIRVYRMRQKIAAQNVRNLIHV